MKAPEPSAEAAETATEVAERQREERAQSLANSEAAAALAALAAAGTVVTSGAAGNNALYFQPSKILYKPAKVHGFREGHEHSPLNGMEAEAIRYDVDSRLFECRISHPQNPSEMATATKMIAASNLQVINCCGHCQCREAEGKKLLACSRCKEEWYCGRECQKKAWKGHKLQCKATQAAAGSWSPDLPPNPESCPICFVTQMNTTAGPNMNATLMECCSKKICGTCLKKVPIEAGCPFCREPFSTSDAQSVGYLRKRAAAGDADAQFNLAGCYDAGMKGVARDFTRAVELYRSAAEQGHARAAMNLAVSYREGEGVAPDKGEMIRWYKVAAEGGHAAAQCNLGLCYGRGDGVAQDMMAGVKLLVSAAKQGDPVATSSLAQNGIVGPDFALPQ